MKMTKQEALRLAQLARLTVKGPKKMLKAYTCGAFNDFEYASVLIENLRKDKNIILIAKNFMAYPKGTGEWVLGKALTWALDARKKEKEFRKHLREREKKRYEDHMRKKFEEEKLRQDERMYGPTCDY